MKQKIIKLLASGFGLGLVPVAPGTFGTLLGIPLAFFLWQAGTPLYIAITLVLIFFSIGIASLAGPLFGESDSPKIVIDEVVGYLVTVACLPPTWKTLLAGFVLFRFFDALKPGPIGYLDRTVKGGLGVVVDDLAAGLAANIVLQIISFFTPWLGVQI